MNISNRIAVLHALVLAIIMFSVPAYAADWEYTPDIKPVSSDGKVHYSPFMGDYRFNFMHMDTYDLDVADNIVKRPTTMSPMENWGEHRFRLSPAFNYKKVYIKFDVAILTGKLFGDSESFATGFNRYDIRDKNYGTDISQVLPREGYVQWLSPVGLLKVGHMTSQFGLGMVSNNGLDMENRYGSSRFGDVVERVLFASTPFLPLTGKGKWGEYLTIALSGDLVYQDENAKLRDGDIAAMFTAGVFYNHPDYKNGVSFTYRWQEDDDGDELKAYAINVNGKNRFKFSIGGKQAAGSAADAPEIAPEETTEAPAAPVDPKTETPTPDTTNTEAPAETSAKAPAEQPETTEKTEAIAAPVEKAVVAPAIVEKKVEEAPVVESKVEVATEASSGFDMALSFEYEFATLLGHTNRLQQVSNMDGLDIQGFGAVARLIYELVSIGMDIEFELGYASGDNDPYDDKSTAFFFDPDYNVGMIFFEEMLPLITARSVEQTIEKNRMTIIPKGLDMVPSRGRVTNTIYYLPQLRFETPTGLNMNDSFKVSAGALVITTPSYFSHAYYTFENGGTPTNHLKGKTNSRYIGTEILAGAQFKVWPVNNHLGMNIKLEQSYFMPGAALEDANGDLPSGVWKFMMTFGLMWQ